MGAIYLNKHHRTKKPQFMLNYNFNLYSKSEVPIGSYNGKTIYRKVYDIGNLPNNNTKTIPTNIDFSKNTVLKIYGIAQTVYGMYLPLPNVGQSSQYSITLGIDTKGNISITTNNDRSNFTGIVILEYIKK